MTTKARTAELNYFDSIETNFIHKLRAFLIFKTKTMEKILKLITKYSVKLLILELAPGKFGEKEYLRKYLNDLKKLIIPITDDVELIIKEVKEYYRLPANFTYTKCRKRELVQGRQTCMFFIGEMTKLKDEKIGTYFNGKDRVTVMHGRKTIKNLCESDITLRSDINYLRKIITSKIA